MAAAPDLGSGAVRRGGSSPSMRTERYPAFGPAVGGILYLWHVRAVFVKGMYMFRISEVYLSPEGYTVYIQ